MSRDDTVLLLSVFVIHLLTSTDTRLFRNKYFCTPSSLNGEPDIKGLRTNSNERTSFVLLNELSQIPFTLFFTSKDTEFELIRCQNF